MSLTDAQHKAVTSILDQCKERTPESFAGLTVESGKYAYVRLSELRETQWESILEVIAYAEVPRYDEVIIELPNGLDLLDDQMAITGHHPPELLELRAFLQALCDDGYGHVFFECPWKNL